MHNHNNQLAQKASGCAHSWQTWLVEYDDRGQAWENQTCLKCQAPRNLRQPAKDLVAAKKEEKGKE